MRSVYQPLLIVAYLVSAAPVSGQGAASNAYGFESPKLPHDIKISPNMEVESEAKCQKLSRNPNFDHDAVVGKTWRIYYTWNMKLGTKCVDINFKSATPAIIRRVYYDMHEYLIDQPTWGAASLLMTMGSAQRELLIFDDQGPAGRFLAVSNTVRDGSLGPMRGSVPLLKFQAKLLDGNRYLLLMDCYVGVASLSTRIDQLPNRIELNNVIQSVKHIYGEGHYGCSDELDRNDNMLDLD